MVEGRGPQVVQDEHRGPAGAEQREAVPQPALRRLDAAVPRGDRHARPRLDDPLQFQEVPRGRPLRDRHWPLWQGARQCAGAARCGDGRRRRVRP